MQSLRPWFERHGDQKPRLVNMYGITETTVHVTYRPLSKDDVQSGSVIGVPIPDLQVYILDSQRQPVPIGVPGEMYVGGAGLARGYLKRSELTADRFIPDNLTGKAGSRLYKTGDLARLLPGRDIGTWAVSISRSRFAVFESSWERLNRCFANILPCAKRSSWRSTISRKTSG